MSWNKFKCKECETELVYLTTKDGDLKGRVLVEYNLLSRDEKISLKSDIPIPYDEADHKRIIHVQRCLAYVTKCSSCLEPLIFVTNKTGSKIPIGMMLVTKEERYRYFLGLPVEYKPLEHHPINHFYLCKAKKGKKNDK